MKTSIVACVLLLSVIAVSGQYLGADEYKVEGYSDHGYKADGYNDIGYNAEEYNDRGYKADEHPSDGHQATNRLDYKDQGSDYDKQAYRGMYSGKCDQDGLYYSNENSFIMCSNGNAYEQKCAPGSRNSGYERYSHGDTYYFHDFCDVNLVDEGYNLNQDHGYDYDHPREYEGGSHGYDSTRDEHRPSGYENSQRGNENRDQGYENSHAQGYENPRQSHGQEDSEYNRGYDHPERSYDNRGPAYDNQERSYGNQDQEHSSEEHGYGNQDQVHGIDEPAYGSDRYNYQRDRFPGYPSNVYPRRPDNGPDYRRPPFGGPGYLGYRRPFHPYPAPAPYH